MVNIKYILNDRDYVIMDGSKFIVTIVNGRVMGEYYTREDAERCILDDMVENKRFPNVFFQDKDGELSLVPVQYNFWTDPTLSMGAKCKLAHDILVEKGYRISINASLPTISIERFVTYDNKIHIEDEFFAQGQDAQELLDEVPDDVYRDHFLMVEMTGY